MPFYEAGEHKIDHPPLFACREHKQFLRLTPTFVKEILTASADVVAGNLAEIAAPYVGGDQNAFKLNEYLIPPRVFLYNPDFLKGAAALPFTLIFIDKKFVGIPAAYLTRDRFEGCPDCGVAPPVAAARPASRPAVAAMPKPIVPRPGAHPSSATGSGAVRPPARSPSSSGSGPVPRAPGGGVTDSHAPARRPNPETERRKPMPPGGGGPRPGSP
jgi:hypothetical protein